MLFLYMYASLLSRNQLLKERICSYESKFSPLRVDPLWKGVVLEVTKVVFLVKWRENMMVCPYTLTVS